jgi:nudix-type nucleoside diphosphatase (YffH/AdpP family)
MTTIDKHEVIYQGWGRFLLLNVSEPDGRTYSRQVEDHGDAVCVLPYDPVGEMVTLVRQWRAPAAFASASGLVLEAPAGRLESNMTPEECARREAVEEVGLHLGHLEKIGAVWAGPGFTTERLHMFLAAYSPSDRRSRGGGIIAENEQVEVVEMRIARATEMVASGGIDDLKTIVLIQALEMQRRRA